MQVENYSIIMKVIILLGFQELENGALLNEI